MANDVEGVRAMMPLLVYTGQPLIDTGVATIIAFSKRDSPEQVTEADLDNIAAYITAHYTREPLKSFLTTLYPNSAYVNPTMGEQKRQETMLRYLRGYAVPAEDPEIRCVFCGRPACDVVFRQHIPLTAGEGIINFGPGGRPGLRVCGGCLLASQAFPLGCTIKCAGRALLVHSDNPELTLAFAASFLQENRRILGLLDASGEGKIGYPRTIVVSCLLRIEMDRRRGALVGSLTAYHLTNYGTNADITILHLPSETVDFLRTVQGDMYRPIWQAIVAQAWARPKGAKSTPGDPMPEGSAGVGAADRPVGSRRNNLYEDLFDIAAGPGRARHFVRRYLLRGAARMPMEGGGDADLARRLSLVSWKLTDVFLRKVLVMEKYRIEAIRTVGERLAMAVASNNDTALLKSIYAAKKYQHLRTVLVKADNAQVKAGAQPLIGFDEFVMIFEDNEDFPGVDWQLARDLIYIKVLDTLHHSGWFARNAPTAHEVLDEMAQADTADEEQAAPTT